MIILTQAESPVIGFAMNLVLTSWMACLLPTVAAMASRGGGVILNQSSNSSYLGACRSRNDLIYPLFPRALLAREWGVLVRGWSGLQVPRQAHSGRSVSIVPFRRARSAASTVRWLASDSAGPDLIASGLPVATAWVKASMSPASPPP